MRLYQNLTPNYPLFLRLKSTYSKCLKRQGLGKTKHKPSNAPVHLMSIAQTTKIKGSAKLNAFTPKRGVGARGSLTPALLYIQPPSNCYLLLNPLTPKGGLEGDNG